MTVFGAILGYALGRGIWNGLRGRTRLLRSYDGVKLRGAVFAYGDGVHDDTAVVQRIFDQQGSQKQLPAGTFRITEQVNVGSEARVSGAGPDRTAFCWAWPR
jgi:hypothetical protein